MFENPFKTPSEYAETLGKIGTFGFFSNLILLLIFSANVSDVSSFLLGVFNVPAIKSAITFNDFTIPVGEFLVAGLIALIARIIPLHVFIAKRFGILDWYMLKNILLPLAARSQVSVSEEALERAPKTLSRAIFYDHLNQIDQHYVKMFWDKITWYWFSLELSFFLFFYSISSAICASYKASFFYMLFSVIVILSSMFLRRSAEHATRAELDAIVADQVRANEIEQELQGI